MTEPKKPEPSQSNSPDFTPENEAQAGKIEITSDSRETESAHTEQVEEGHQGALESELEAAQLEVVKLKDAFLRAKAEEDNLRRRTEKEIANSRKFAVEGFAKEMLNVYDSLKLAVAVELAEDADDAIKSVHEGVNITLKQLQLGLSKFSISEIVPNVGDKVDPNCHQAMSLVDSDDVGSGCVVTVIQSGFQLHDRLLRPAMVVVAK